MAETAQFLNPSEAAKRLGVSAKALRLYEQRGLITPVRTSAGWRTYGPAEMAQAAEIVNLRELGLSLAKVARFLGGDPKCLEPGLALHQAALENQIRHLANTVEKVHILRTDLARGRIPTGAELACMIRPEDRISVALDLPWPWGGEGFELTGIRPLTYITGPLGCGKTRLAETIASALPDAVFLGLERLAGAGAETRIRLDNDPALRSRVDQTMAWLVEDGAKDSEAMMALLAALENAEPTILIVDMVEQGLDQASQEALIGHLRHRARGAAPLFLLTRSRAILDLTAVGPDEAIIFCPANHSPPIEVLPYPGTPGYEAVESCLASPAVRARTEGTIAWRPKQSG